MNIWSVAKLLPVMFLLFFSAILIFSIGQNVYGIELFSKNEKPFGTSYDDWIAKYWNWDVGLSNEKSTPKPDGCLINNDNKPDSLVMLMETTVDGTPHQVCKISSKQGIMIPLWIAWSDNSPGGTPRNMSEPLAKSAREQYNLGNIKSDVKVDGVPLAKLDVRQSLLPGSGKFDYKIFSLANVTDISTKNFNLTIPSNTHEQGAVPGTWQAGSQGWYVFLKPLPPGQHTIFYNARVTPTGPLTSPGTNPHFADITYKLNVTK